MVKTGKTQREYIFSACPLRADIAWEISRDRPPWERPNSAIAVLSSLGFSENPRGKTSPPQTSARPITIREIPKASIANRFKRMGPASRFEIRPRDAFAPALWELGHYRRAPRRAPRCNASDQERRRRQAGSAERGVAILGPGDYVRVWRSRELERSGKLACTDTLSTELTGSTIPAAVILFVACYWLVI